MLSNKVLEGMGNFVDEKLKAEMRYFCTSVLRWRAPPHRKNLYI